MRKLVLPVVLSIIALLTFASLGLAASPQDQWAGTKHNVKNLDTAAEDAPAKRDNCIACHDGEGFANNVVKRADLPAEVRTTLNSVDCGACHGERATEMMTTGKTGKLANGLAVEGAGKGALCIYCHNARKLADPAKKPAPHRSPQADVLFAANGARTPGKSYPSSPHGANPDTCVSCHMAELDGIANHTFAVIDSPGYVKEACASCHDGLTTVNRTSLADYDGDKVIEGFQDEVKGLVELLAKAAEEKENALGAHFGESHGAIHWTDKANNEVKVPDALYNARFNLALVEEDGSEGIHNPAFVVTLLQDSYKQLTGKDVPGAALR